MVECGAGRLANTLYRIARANSVVSGAAMAELYNVASTKLSPMYLGNSGLEGLIDGHWVEVKEAEVRSETHPKHLTPIRDPQR